MDSVQRTLKLRKVGHILKSYLSYMANLITIIKGKEIMKADEPWRNVHFLQ